MMMSRRLWETNKSSIGCRTESVSMMHHGQSVVVSTTAADQTQRNFFFRILPVWLMELPGSRVLQSRGDIDCRLLRRECTSQPDMMELLDGGICRPTKWPYTPPAAKVVANVNNPKCQQWYDQTSTCTTHLTVWVSRVYHPTWHTIGHMTVLAHE